MKPGKHEILDAAPASPKKAPKPRCTSKTKAGLACKAPPTADGACPLHSKRFSEQEKKAWRERGQRASMRLRMPTTFVRADLSSEDGARAMLEEACDAVRSGKLPVSVANAISKLAAVGLRLGELKLAAQLAAIERRLEGESGPKRRKR